MSDDPGRDIIMAAAERGYISPGLAEELDRWASELATELTEGRITPTEAQRRVLERLERDIARRGVA